MILPPWLWGLVVSATLNVVQLVLGVRWRREAKAARASDLICELTRGSREVRAKPVMIYARAGEEPVEQSWIEVIYVSELRITNRSDRPNSITSIRLQLSGVRPFGLPGLVTHPERRKMIDRHPDFGDPLLPPVNVPAGVSTISGYVAFEATFYDPHYDPEAPDGMRFRLIIGDGHGLTYEIGGSSED